MSACAIPDTPAASAATSAMLFNIEKFLFMIAPYLNVKGLLQRKC
jgi:hypothetical protein